MGGEEDRVVVEAEDRVVVEAEDGAVVETEDVVVVGAEDRPVVGAVLGGRVEAVKARDFIRHDTPWSRLFNLAFLPSYRVLVIEFLSSFEFHPRPADQPGEADDQRTHGSRLVFDWRGVA
ncbi:hypothetical protein Hanom_Chr15g01369561 [Helianthus anomalus]